MIIIHTEPNILDIHIVCGKVKANELVQFFALKLYESSKQFVLCLLFNVHC